MVEEKSARLCLVPDAFFLSSFVYDVYLSLPTSLSLSFFLFIPSHIALIFFLFLIVMCGCCCCFFAPPTNLSQYELNSILLFFKKFPYPLFSPFLFVCFTRLDRADETLTVLSQPTDKQTNKYGPLLSSKSKKEKGAKCRWSLRQERYREIKRVEGSVRLLFLCFLLVL